MIDSICKNIKNQLCHSKEITFTVCNTDNYGWSKEQYLAMPKVCQELSKEGISSYNYFNFGTLVYVFKLKAEN